MASFGVPMAAHVTLSPRQLARALGAAALGGFTGTALRYLLTGLEHLPAVGAGTTWPQEIPWMLLGINVVGVYLATRLLRGRLRHHDPNDLARILVITGFFGGLTSYSTLYVDFAALWHVDVAGCFLVVALALGSGVGAAWLGLKRRRQ